MRAESNAPWWALALYVVGTGVVLYAAVAQLTDNVTLRIVTSAALGAPAVWWMERVLVWLRPQWKRSEPDGR